jgi:hypothetical protein
VKDWVLIIGGYELIAVIGACGLLGLLSALLTMWLMPEPKRKGKRRGAHRPWYRKALRSEAAEPAKPPAETLALPVVLSEMDTERIPKIPSRKGKP